MKKQTEEKILTLHPLGKKGVNISKTKYELIKSFIIDTITKHKVITFNKLVETAANELTNKFDGKVTWYIVTVKLDLEAREIIERVTKTSPQQLKLK